MRTHPVLRAITAWFLTLAVALTMAVPARASEAGPEPETQTEEADAPASEVESGFILPGQPEEPPPEEDPAPNPEPSGEAPGPSEPFTPEEQKEPEIPESPELPEEREAPEASEEPAEGEGSEEAEALEELEELEELDELGEPLQSVLPRRLRRAAGQSGGLWAPDSRLPEDGEQVLVIQEREGRWWSLRAPAQAEAPPTAVEVFPASQRLADPAPGMVWTVLWEEGAMMLCSPEPEGRLYFSSRKSKLGVGASGDGYWELQSELLTHRMTGAALTLTEEEPVQWVAGPGAGAGQRLRFWYITQETEIGPPKDPDPPEPQDPQEPELPYELFFGQLHAHTNLSDGWGSVEDAFRYAAGVENLDFFAVTDHSDSFDSADTGRIASDAADVCQAWARGKAAARAVTGEDFVGLFGYEMTWNDDALLGHINTFATPGFQTGDQPAFCSLEAYYEALAAVPGAVGQFNHPGMFQANFQWFGGHTPLYDRNMNLLEVYSEDGWDAYRYYVKALDARWHVGPTCSENNHNGLWAGETPGRTVLLAQALTETALYEAMSQRRCYATQDGALRLYYSLNGGVMGSILEPGDRAEIYAWLSHPEEPVGTVQVVTEGGEVLLNREITENRGELRLSVPGGKRYYFLRVIQPDGDTAVTAPVWMETAPTGSLTDFSTEDPPLRGRESTFRLTLRSDSERQAEIEFLRLMVGDQEAARLESPGTLAPFEERELTLRYAHPELGTAVLRAEVRVRFASRTETWSRELSLTYRPDTLPAGVLVEGSGLGGGTLEALRALAAQAGAGLTVFTGELPEAGNLLLLAASPETDTPEFTAGLRTFLERGGSLVVCGGAGEASRTAANTLLEAMEASLQLTDPGGPEGAVYTSRFSGEAALCAGAAPGQIYCQRQGFGVSPGRGQTLVPGQTGDAALLAWEPTRWGGKILAAGGAFFTDGAMGLTPDAQGLPSLNQTILENLLGLSRQRYPLSAVADVRQGVEGQSYRVRGHLTSGTTNPSTAFPGTVYLQDATGGIAVTGVPDTLRAQIGQAIEVTGPLCRTGGNLTLFLLEYTLTQETMYRYQPKTPTARGAMDYGLYGGELLRLDGTVTERTLTADGRGVASFTVKDSRGDLARVLIEPGIRSGSTGENTLASVVKVGRTVRAVGICHMDGGQTVLRVRNCDEILDIPPRKHIPDPDNPKTGDFWAFLPGLS